MARKRIERSACCAGFDGGASFASLPPFVKGDTIRGEKTDSSASGEREQCNPRIPPRGRKRLTDFFRIRSKIPDAAKYAVSPLDSLPLILASQPLMKK